MHFVEIECVFSLSTWSIYFTFVPSAGNSCITSPAGSSEVWRDQGLYRYTCLDLRRGSCHSPYLFIGYEVWQSQAICSKPRKYWWHRQIFIFLLSEEANSNWVALFSSLHLINTIYLAQLFFPPFFCTVGTFKTFRLKVPMWKMCDSVSLGNICQGSNDSIVFSHLQVRFVFLKLYFHESFCNCMRCFASLIV